MAKQEPCSNCDLMVPQGQRFCSSCGEPNGDDVFLLNVGGPAKTATTVSTNGRSSARWLGALGLVIAAVIGWSLLTSPDREPASEAVAQEGLVDDGTNADQPDDDAEADDGFTSSPDGSAEEDEDANSPVTTTIEPGGLEREPFGGEDDGPDLLTGQRFENSGLSVVVGNPIRIIDLDTGSVEETNLRLSPALVIDDYLIVRSRSGSGGIYSLRLDDLDADRVPLAPSDSYVFQVKEGEAPGSVVLLATVFDSDVSTYVERVVDLESGLLLRENDVDPRLVVFGISNGRFFSPRSGGVYERQGNEQRRVNDGRVVAEGEAIVLVETCDEVLECSTAWLSTDTFTSVDLPIPDGISDGFVVANDRVLVHVSSGLFTFDLFDLATGRQLADQLMSEQSLPVSVSPDGRFVAFNSAGLGFVLDLETGRRIEIQVRNSYEAPVLIESP